MTDKTWNALFSMVTEYFKRQGNTEAYLFCKKASLDTSFYGMDAAEIDYYILELYFDFYDYLTLDNPNKYSDEIKRIINKLNPDSSIAVEAVVVKPLTVKVYDWESILPETQSSAIELIFQEKEMLTSIATGQLSYKLDGVEEEYSERHKRILSIAQTVGFDYPIPFNSLAEWWVNIRSIETYAARTAHINEMFAAILEPIQIKANFDSSQLDFSTFQNRSAVIDLAIKDANVLIRNGSFVSATDRVHTAFRGYLELLLKERGIGFNSSDTLQTLYSKLHHYYEHKIESKEVANLVKTALRSASGIVNSINEIRNKFSASHPNEKLIQEREAKLLVQLVMAIVRYIEEIEKES